MFTPIVVIVMCAVLVFVCWWCWDTWRYADSLEDSIDAIRDERDDYRKKAEEQIAELVSQLDASAAKLREAEPYREEYEKLKLNHIDCIHSEREKVAILMQSLEIAEERYNALLDAARNLQRVVDIQAAEQLPYKGAAVFGSSANIEQRSTLGNNWPSKGTS